MRSAGLPQALPAQVTMPLRIGRNRAPTNSATRRMRSPSTLNAGCTSKPLCPPPQAEPSGRSAGLPYETNTTRERSPPTIGFNAPRNFAKFPGSARVERALGGFRRGEHAVEQHALARRIDDDVGHEPGEIDVVRADSEQHEVERAVRPRAPRGREVALQLRDLRRHRARTVLSGAQLSSRARCEPSTPASIVAPVQASGRKVTATCGFSIASASAVRI